MKYRKRNAAIAAVLLLMALGWRGAAQEARPPFASGEKLHYAVKWRGVPAGEAEILLGRVESPRPRWKAVAKANSLGYVSNLYKVEDEYQSTFRAPALCSNEIRKTINEGDRHRLVTLTFDPRRRLALYSDREAAGNAPPRQAQSAIPDCVQDILSSLYFVRARPLLVGQSFDVPVNDGERTIQVRFEVQAKEQIKTPIGTFQATRVEPVLFSGNLFKSKGRMFVWFSDDAARLPVQLSAQIGIGVGTITASLTEVEKSDGNP